MKFQRPSFKVCGGLSAWEAGTKIMFVQGFFKDFHFANCTYCISQDERKIVRGRLKHLLCSIHREADNVCVLAQKFISNSLTNGKNISGKCIGDPFQISGWRITLVKNSRTNFKIK